MLAERSGQKLFFEAFGKHNGRKKLNEDEKSSIQEGRSDRRSLARRKSGAGLATKRLLGGN